MYAYVHAWMDGRRSCMHCKNISSAWNALWISISYNKVQKRPFVHNVLSLGDGVHALDVLIV